MAAQHLPRYLGGLAVNKRTRSNERRRPISQFFDEFSNAAQCFFDMIVTASFPVSPPTRGATSSSAIFMKFHSMTSSCLFNRGTTFSQTVTYNNNVFVPADTKSIVQTHTFCTTLVNKNRTFYNSVGD